MKTLATLSALLAVWLVARAARAYDRPAGAAALLVGANPLLLAFGVGGGHNDLLVMAAGTGAIVLLARPPRPWRAGALLAVAAALKATGGLLAPFAVLGTRPRSRILWGFLTTGAALAGLTIAVFGAGVGVQVGRVATAQNFVAKDSGPDLLGRLLGTGVTPAVRLACAAAAAIVIVICLWRTWRGADWLTAAALSAVAALVAVPSLVPWYISWALPAAALARSRWARVAVAALTTAIVVIHLPVLGFDAY